MCAKDYEFLEHSSDLYVKGYGEGLGAVASVVRGLGEFLGARKKEVAREFSKPKGEFWEVDLLSEILSVADAEGWTPVDAQVLPQGLRVFFQKRPMGSEVKGVTYHLFERGDNYIKVLFDI